MKAMVENLIHHKDDYECMWNGIEDLYMNKTGQELPNQFFFAMSGLSGFVYMKTNKSDKKRLVSFGEGRTKQMYKLLSPIVGFEYRFIECKSPKIALEKAKREIDCGYPVVLGALDMYYLEYYPKLYHQEHVPFHYVLMIGYDDELKKIYLYDCGREERLELSYNNLYSAMNAEYEGLSKKNTICTIRMENPNSKEQIMKTALEYKANLFINPPTGFLGIKGIQKLAKEISSWEEELGKEETIKIFKNMVMFFGSVPTLPNRLLGRSEKDEVVFMCSRDKLSKLFSELSLRYSKHFMEASDLFAQSGKQFEILCNFLVDYLLGVCDYKDKVRTILLKIADLEYKAYEHLLLAVKEI